MRATSCAAPSVLTGPVPRRTRTGRGNLVEVGRVDHPVCAVSLRWETSRADVPVRRHVVHAEAASRFMEADSLGDVGPCNPTLPLNQDSGVRGRWPLGGAPARRRRTGIDSVSGYEESGGSMTVSIT